MLEPSRLVGFLLEPYLSNRDLLRLSETCKSFDDYRRPVIRRTSMIIPEETLADIGTGCPSLHRFDLRRLSIELPAGDEPTLQPWPYLTQLSHLAIRGPIRRPTQEIRRLTELRVERTGDTFDRCKLVPMVTGTTLVFGPGVEIEPTVDSRVIVQATPKYDQTE